MCAQLTEHGLGDLVNLTVSCDSHPLREARKQCGCCTSCLLRRLSLHAGGLGAQDDRALYREDIYALNQRAQDRYLRPYEFMRQQAVSFEALTRPDRALAFRVEHEALEDVRHAVSESESLTLAQADARLSDLFRRYALEFSRFDAVVAGLVPERMSA
jgi:hypothetical protein